MTDNAVVAVVIDELDPGTGVVRLTRDVTEGEPEAVVRGWVELDFPWDVVEPYSVQKGVILVQAVGSVEEDVVVATTAWGSLD